MKHYVIIFEWSATLNEVVSGIEISGIAHSLKEAKEIFAKVIVGEKQYAEENNWIIYEDSDVEFNVGEDGNYESEHAHFYIQEVL
jgi:hypothetical protein